MRAQVCAAPLPAHLSPERAGIQLSAAETNHFRRARANCNANSLPPAEATNQVGALPELEGPPPGARKPVRWARINSKAAPLQRS